MVLFSTVRTAVLAVLFVLIRCADNSSKFYSSSCGELLVSEDAIDHGHMKDLLPTEDFWDFFTNKTSSASDILLVDVDNNSWKLLLNQVVALRKSGSALAHNVYAVAYDNSTCTNLIHKKISCYYNKDWIGRLNNKYTEQTRHSPSGMHTVMLGRMMTTAVTLCEGHNVFLTDTDVVFYRDPIQYAFHEADIMITATKIHPALSEWGGTYFTDLPGQMFTLNNGVVFYRSNPLMKEFALTLAANCVNSLFRRHNPDSGFLQKVFNAGMVRNKLVLQPCHMQSDPATYRLTSADVNNTVGECYDCHFGQFPWYSDVVHSAPVSGSGAHSPLLKIGVYPMKRYTSFCDATNQTALGEALTEAANALRHHNHSHWAWGALTNHTSRVLFTHANCVDLEGSMRDRFLKKIDWLHSTGSWFL